MCPEKRDRRAGELDLFTVLACYCCILHSFNILVNCFLICVYYIFIKKSIKQNSVSRLSKLSCSCVSHCISASALLILGARSFEVRAILCIEGCWATSLAFTHQVPAALSQPKMCLDIAQWSWVLELTPVWEPIWCFRSNLAPASATPSFSGSFIDFNPVSEENTRIQLCGGFSTMPGLRISTNSEKDINQGWQTTDLKPNPSCFLCV